MDIEHYDRRDSGLLVPKQQVIGAGRYDAKLIREGEVIDEFSFDNLVVNEGLNSMLGVHLGGATQITAWYLGLFSGNYTPVSTDTAATFAASATESVAYTAGMRQQFSPAAPSGQSITNVANKATFTFTATTSIYGAFLASAAANNATTGVLFSAARFSAPKAVVANDQLLLTYTFTAASA